MKTLFPSSTMLNCHISQPNINAERIKCWLSSECDVQTCSVRLCSVLPRSPSTDKAISLTAAADIYDPRHPVGSRKHITFMEEALIRLLFWDLCVRPAAAVCPSRHLNAPQCNKVLTVEPQETSVSSNTLWSVCLLEIHKPESEQFTK